MMPAVVHMVRCPVCRVEARDERLCEDFEQSLWFPLLAAGLGLNQAGCTIYPSIALPTVYLNGVAGIC